MQAAIEARYPPANYSYDELEELVLDGCKIKKISKEDGLFLSQFKTLTSLSCSRTGLVSIENFPVLTTLTVLILLDNSLSTTQSHLDTLSTCTPNLRVLQLAGNRLNDIHLFIQYLSPLKHLEVLDVEMNCFNKTKEDNSLVFFELFKKLPELKVLDGRDKNGDDVDDEDAEEDDEDEEETEEDVDEDIEDEELVDEIDDLEKEDDDDDKTDATFLSDCRANLKAFYEKDYSKENEDEDDYFNPLDDVDEEDEDDEEDEEDEDDDEDEDEEDYKDEDADNAEADLKSSLEPVNNKSESSDAKPNENNLKDTRNSKKQRV